MEKKRRGPPLGSKNALGHGRKPNKGFADEDLVKLGEEFFEWMRKADLEDRRVVHLSEFWSELKNIRYSQWESLKTREVFAPYWEKAKFWMGRRILDHEKINPSYGHRFLSIYFTDLRDHERTKDEEKIRTEIEIKIQSMKKEFPNDAKLDELLDSIKRPKNEKK